MDTSALLAYLRTLGEPLTLSADDRKLPAALQDFLTGVPGRRLVVAAGGGDGLRLDGTTLTVSGASSASWPVDDLGNAAVTPQSVWIRCTADDHVTGAVTGHLPLNAAVRAPVTVTSLPPVKSVDGPLARGWRIGLTADVTGVTPMDLLLLLGRPGADLPLVEPAGLTALARRLTVPADGFEITFYPGTTHHALLTFSVDVPALTWAPVPGLLSLDRIGLAATVSAEGWSAAVVGRFTLGTVAMQLTVGLTDDTSLLAYLKPVGAAAFPGLAAFAAWVAGGARGVLAESQPDAASEIDLDMTPGLDPGLVSEPVSGVSAMDVSAIGGDAAAVDAAIRAVAVHFDGATAKLRRVDVLSLLTLGALQLDVAFRYPDGTIAGSLHDGKPLALTAVLASFGLPTADLPAGARVIEAGFSATPAFGSYLADLTVDTDLAAGPLKIERVFASVAHSAGEGITGQLGGSVTFGSGLRIDLLAAYGGTADGWEFSGCTAPDTELAIGDLLADLAKAFGAGSVPEPVTTMALTEVAMAYRSGTGAFTFTCTGGLRIADTPVSATIAIDIRPAAPSGYERTFSGRVTIGGLQFDLVFDIAGTGSPAFAGSYTHTGADNALALHDLVAEISSEAARAVPSGLDIGLREARLLYLKPQAAPAVFALGLVLSDVVDLSRLPLVGDRLPADEKLAVDGLQVLYSSAPLTEAELKRLDGLLPSTATRLPAGPLEAGVGITALLQAGPARQNAALKVPPATQTQTGMPPAPAVPAGHWLDVQRQLGVVHINRIGLLYQSGALFVALDAAIALGPLSLSLDGLCFGSPLAKFVPEFRLDGLGLAYASGPLTISGAMLRVPKARLAPGVAFQFDGMLRISAQTLEIVGIGSYAEFQDGQPSLFVFAQLEAPLGGPPAFFVDGLMGGFGFNRTVALPGPDEVTDFPLVALGTPSVPGKPPAAQDPGHVLDVLEGRVPITPGGRARRWIAPQPGALWLALGVAFTSYELLHTKALLVADISKDFKLAVLGTSTLRMPQAGDSPMTYAYVELGLEAVLEPVEGYFGLTAILSRDSYVISPECHLTGGFALAVWFGANPHAGEFVLTLGGYHPAFAVPGYFPRVPRLGFSWAVSHSVAISGSAYAALTTSCFMAGGRLAAVFHHGSLRAWFTVEADLLVSWRPFFFTGHFALSIGVSYSFSVLWIHTTISVSVGAKLAMWGPPTGGTVHVSLWVVSFTVAFGDRRRARADAPLTWPQFRELLPAAKGAVVIQPSGRLQSTLPAGADAETWVVRATGFAFRTQSALPVSDLRYGPPPADRDTSPAAARTPSVHDHSTDPIDIKPMNLTGVTSVHRLTVRHGSATAEPCDLAGWTLTPRSATVPDSLWGKPPEKFTQIPAHPSAEVLPGRHVGYDVKTPAPVLGATRGTVSGTVLVEDVIAQAALPLRSGAQTGRYHPVADPDSIAEIAGIAGAAAGPRGLLYAQVAAATGFAGPNGTLDRLAAQAAELYNDSPMREG